jgi:ribonuclease P protein component
MKIMALPKSLLLSRLWQYKKVYAGGKRVRGPGFSLIFLANEVGRSRLGISVHGVGQAVRRNRIKRIIREFFRHDPVFIGHSMDVIFAVRPECSLDSPAEVEAAVRRALSCGGKRPG